MDFLFILLNKKIYVLLFHAAVLVMYMFTSWYDQMYVDIPLPTKEFEEMPLKARYVYFTYWNLVLQTVYFMITLLNDIIGTDEQIPKQRPFIRKLRDFVFSIAFSFALSVSVVFWSLTAINKNFVMTEEVEKALPKWLNHVMHSMVSVFIFIEMFVTNKTYPSRRLGVSVVTGVPIIYVGWAHVIYYKTGVWVYPIFDLLNQVTRLILFSSTVVLAFVIYILGEKLSSLKAMKSTVISNGTNEVSQKDVTGNMN